MRRREEYVAIRLPPYTPTTTTTITLAGQRSELTAKCTAACNVHLAFNVPITFSHLWFVLCLLWLQCKSLLCEICTDSCPTPTSRCLFATVFCLRTLQWLLWHMFSCPKWERALLFPNSLGLLVINYRPFFHGAKFFLATLWNCLLVGFLVAISPFFGKRIAIFVYVVPGFLTAHNSFLA